MARQPKKEKEVTPLSKLLEAVKFISVTQKAIGTPNETHCSIGYGYLVAFNGVIAAGARVDTQLRACPHTLSFSAALAKCRGTVSFGLEASTNLTGERLRVTDNRFTAIIDTLELSALSTATPDDLIVNVDNSLLVALNTCCELLSDITVLGSSLLLRANTCVTTNRIIVLEAWHGYDLPTLTVPKEFIAAISKTGKDLDGLGFGRRTLTVWFTDGSWLRSQLYTDEWPSRLDHVLNEVAPLHVFDDAVSKAIAEVASFSDDMVKVTREEVLAYAEKHERAKITLDQAQRFSFSVNPKLFALVEKHLGAVDIVDNTLYFMKDNARGVMKLLKE
jgi:hypothetical protein